MTEGLIITAILLLLAVVVMLVVVLRRATSTDLSPVISRLETMEKSQERTERGVKEEIARNRQESTEQGRGLREEVQVSLKNSTDSLVQSLDRISAAQQQRLEDFANQLNALTQAGDTSASQLRLELTNALSVIKESQEKRLSENAVQLQQHFDSFDRRLSEFSQAKPGRRDADSHRAVRRPQGLQRLTPETDERHGGLAEAAARFVRSATKQLDREKREEVR